LTRAVHLGLVLCSIRFYSLYVQGAMVHRAGQCNINATLICTSLSLRFTTLMFRRARQR